MIIKQKGIFYECFPEKFRVPQKKRNINAYKLAA